MHMKNDNKMDWTDFQSQKNQQLTLKSKDKSNHKWKHMTCKIEQNLLKQCTCPKTLTKGQQL